MRLADRCTESTDLPWHSDYSSLAAHLLDRHSRINWLDSANNLACSQTRNRLTNCEQNGSNFIDH